MTRPKFGDSMFQLLEDNLAVADSIGAELRFQVKTVLQSQIEKMDLVTKQEFDVSQAALEKALQRIEELEHKIGASKK